MNNYNIFRSRTFWTVLVMFIVGGGNAIVPVIPPAFQAVVTGLLGVLAISFHLDTAQRAGATNK